MPTNLKRVTINVPSDIYSMIEKDALFNRRPEASQVIWVLDRWYSKKKEELDFFKPPRLHEAKRADAPQFFETPSEPLKESVSKIREKLGRDNT